MRILALLLILIMPNGVGAATLDHGSVTAALPSAIERLQERKAIDAAMAGDLQRLYRDFEYEPLWHLSPVAEPRAAIAVAALRTAASLDANIDAAAETPE